jgi:hypothetical protein
MKKLFGILSIVCLVFTFQLQAQTKETPFLTKSLQGASVKDVKVETAGGSIVVEGITSGEQRVEMYVRSNDRHNDLSKAEIQKKLDEDYIIDISVANNKLTASAKQKNKVFNWKNALSVSFKVYTPKNISSDLNTSGGSISISNVSGNQDFKTSGGSLQVDHVTGKIKGRTSGGSIEVSDSDNDIDLSTSGGSISAKNCNGKIDLHTSGGSLQLKNLKGDIEAKTSGGSVHGKDVTGEINAHTSGGNIDFENISGSLDASTSGGNIDVEMIKLDKYLTLHNSGGSVHLTVPKNQGFDLNLKGDRVKSIALNNFSGSMEDDEVKGKLNGGGAAITVKGNGSIHLAFK